MLQNICWKFYLNNYVFQDIGQIFVLFDLFPSLFMILPRQLKGDSWHQDEGEEYTLGAVVLSGPGEGVPEGAEEVYHCTLLWTIDHEHWRFLDSLRQTV